ncbi:quinohemoprotein amine dehydrogenase subunit beta [Marinobacterium arenosum]|uniref:quinohemoprotein amine dehydrogenase subunit beta n=1 Tax=Marinobacterium arenosum TaxID=2862496 RepID=UPI001C948F60|nr:quinohemoprotein amine dehydrogenase subunit beta [Marinobacterium arenosum]MBY4676627.1 quinohemoprotein amine dehydrogenase subunit beta [Marinobacterium arenosum]
MRLNNLTKRAGLALTLAGSALLAGCAGGLKTASMDAHGHEYILTSSRPNQLHVIDAETDQLVRSCDIPGIFGSNSIVSSPDGRIAYVLTNKWEDVYGFDITNCEMRFSAKQSYKNVQIKSIISLAVSPDGKELYTVQNPVVKHRDRFEVQQPRLAVFETADGLNAKPKRFFPVDRRITKIGTLDSGGVILGGADLKTIDPQTGEVKLLKALQNWQRPADQWVPPDAFAMQAQGEHVGEYILPYFTIKWNGEPGDMEQAEFWWGMNRIDLASGEIESQEIVPFEFIFFNLVTDPNDRDIVYGAFNNLSKHNVKERRTLATEDLAHTYYTINMTRDGGKIYVGGTSSDISIHDPKTLNKIGSIQLPGDMSTADLRIAKLIE